MEGAVVVHAQSQRPLGDFNRVDLGQAGASADARRIVDDDFVSRRLPPNAHLELRPRLGNAGGEMQERAANARPESALDAHARSGLVQGRRYVHAAADMRIGALTGAGVNPGSKTKD